MKPKVKFRATLAVLVTALALTACGGGGGGGATTPPATGTLSVAPATCTVASGLGKCNATATFATANATTASLTNAGGTVLSTSLSGSQVVDVLIGANTYNLFANGSQVASANATGVCETGTASNGTICVPPVTASLTATSPIVNGATSTVTWGHSGGAPTTCASSANWTNSGSLTGTGQSNALTSDSTLTYACTNANGTTTATAAVTVCAVGETVTGGVCGTPVLRYTDKVYALWTGAYPFVVTKTGVTKVVNKTRYAGSMPFYNCWLSETPLSDGKVLASCQYVVDYTRSVYYIDPTKDELYEYTGTVPGNIVWKDVQSFDPATPTLGAKTRVTDGLYFTTFDIAWVLKFQADVTNVVTVVKAGTFEVDETVNLLMTYNN